MVNFRWPTAIELSLEAGSVKDSVLKALVEARADRAPVQALDLWSRTCRFRQQAGRKIITPSTFDRHCRADNVRTKGGEPKFLGQDLRDHGIELVCGSGHNRTEREVHMQDYDGVVKKSYVAAVRL